MELNTAAHYHCTGIYDIYPRSKKRIKHHLPHLIVVVELVGHLRHLRRDVVRGAANTGKTSRFNI
jgi:hypothetical protein